MVPVIAAQQSLAGIKPANEDACNLQIPSGELLYSKGVVATIADGVSSSAGAAEASRGAVQGLVSDYYSTPESWTVTTAISKIYSALNQWLLGHGQRVFSNSGELVTTLSTLIIKSATATIFHVGDSRVYHYRDGTLEQVTQDHRIKGRGDKEYLGRAMGINHHLEVDVHRITINPGDHFLLCTDGVHEFVSDREISTLIEQQAAAEPKQLVEQLLQLALSHGSNDNLTAQFLTIQQLPDEEESELYQRLQELPFPPELSAGMQIDGFKILRELHSSARTQVYLALDSHTEQQVVIKTPSVNYEDDPTYLDTFRHEEWVGLRIESPHLIEIKAVRERRRFLYYVTEYIDGITLRQWMEENPQPPLAEVRQIAAQLIRGLRAFHRMEMVHRDLKPENIMIDHHGTVKIIDLGSTRISGIEECKSLTDHSRVHSTRNYSAPELIRGELGTAQSDQFSLAVILYEMLSGKLPYGTLGDHPSISRVLQKLQRSRFTALHHHNENPPLWAGSALQMALDPNPKQRYPALSELLADLTQANPSFRMDTYQPLIERDPLTFWRALSLVLLLSNIGLLIWLGISTP